MNDIYIKKEKKRGLLGIIGTAIKGVVISYLIVFLLGVAGGMWWGHGVWGVDNPPDQYTTEIQRLNDLTEEKNKNYMTTLSMTESEIEGLKEYNRNIQATNDRLINEQIQNSITINYLKMELESKEREIARLKAVKSSSTNTYISSNTPAQTAQIPAVTTSTAYMPAFNYEEWASRPTYPSVPAFTTVTSNVTSFANGKTFEQLVNSIRALEYLSHVNDNNNYAIQYADETIVKGGGDCTDKVLLLYACLKSQGYDDGEMGVASISSCDGSYNHNVLVMTEPPVDTSNVDSHYRFELGGNTWYVIDPTDWQGRPVIGLMEYYNECYRVGNIHFYNTDTLGGWDKVPIHGLEMKR